MTRMACGNTIRRMTRPRFIPKAWAASVWPCSTEMMPARTISAMYAASLKPRPRSAAINGGIKLFVFACSQNEVKGMPMSMLLRTRFRLNQKKICTSTGVPRKNQMYSQLTQDITGLGDKRITARITPRTIPMAIASTVNSRVTRIPLKMRVLKR